MQSGRLRTSQLWFRIALARLKSVPYLTPVLVVVLVTTVVMGPNLSPQRPDDLMPEPGPSEPAPTPTRRVEPTRPPVVPVVRTSAPAPTRTTRPPSSAPTSRRPPEPRPTASRPTASRPTASRPTGSRPTGSRPTGSPAPSVVTTEPTTAPTTSSPPVEPLVLTAVLDRSPLADPVACDAGDTIRFTGTIGVNRTAAVTWEWEPAAASTDPVTATISAGGKRTVVRRVAVSGRPGQVRSGRIRLIVSAPGAAPVTATSAYTFTCAREYFVDQSAPPMD